NPQLGIAVTGTDPTGTWYFSLDDGMSWAELGVVTEFSARLLSADPGTRIYYRPPPEFNGHLLEALRFRAWDQTSGINGSLAIAAFNGGTTAFSTASVWASLTVVPVNDPPVITAPSSVTTPEDTPLAFSSSLTLSVSDIDSTNLTVSLAVSHGTLS